MAVLSCNASSSAPVASMGQIRRIASTNNRPQNTLAIARVPLSSSVCIRLSGMREIQAVPAWRQHRFESHCIPSASDGDTSIAKSTTVSPFDEYQDVGSAMTVVTGFYEAINRKDMKALNNLIADGCIYNDLSFPEAFEGRKPVLQFMKDLMDAMGKGMVFVIDGISEGDAFTVGVMSHLEWEGKPFPFTRGCSFFQCEKRGERLLIRDVRNFIESPVKPGELVLRLLKTITSMFEQFPLLAKNFFGKPYYVFAGFLMIYNKYVKPSVLPIVYPFVLYYRGIVNTFLYWASCLLKIVLRIWMFFSS